MATTEQWKDDLASRISSILATNAAQIARIEALEAQAAHKPAQAEQGQEQGKELWERMLDAVGAATAGDDPLWPALMDAVADWLDDRTCSHAASLLSAEAQATREGRRD